MAGLEWRGGGFVCCCVRGVGGGLGYLVGVPQRVARQVGTGRFLALLASFGRVFAVALPPFGGVGGRDGSRGYGMEGSMDYWMGAQPGGEKWCEFVVLWYSRGVSG